MKKFIKHLTDKRVKSIRENQHLYGYYGSVSSSLQEKLDFCCIGEYSQFKYGDIKKGQGDLVLINFNRDEYIYPTEKNLLDGINHMINIDRIETQGIFTNIYLGKKYFAGLKKYVILTSQKRTLWIKLKEWFSFYFYKFVFFVDKQIQ